MWCILRSENDFIYIFLRKTLTQKKWEGTIKTVQPFACSIMGIIYADLKSLITTQHYLALKINDDELK